MEFLQQIWNFIILNSKNSTQAEDKQYYIVFVIYFHSLETTTTMIYLISSSYPEI